MDLSPVIERLRGELPATLVRTVGGSADLDAAISGVVAMPAIFVVPLADRVLPAPVLGVVEEQTSEAFAVLQVVSNKRDATGGQALVDLSVLRIAVRDALAGWMPTPKAMEPGAAQAMEPVQRTGGRLLRFDVDGRLWWSDEFAYVNLWRKP